MGHLATEKLSGINTECGSRQTRPRAPAKTCRKCGKRKRLKSFYKAREYKGKIYRFPDCKKCFKESAKARHQQKKVLGISPEQKPQTSTKWLSAKL